MSGEETNRSRRMTGRLGVVPPAQASECPSCTQPRAGRPQAVPRGTGLSTGLHLVPTTVCRPEIHAADEPPIWMAALLAVRCQAVADREERSVRWDCTSGRATYTNQSEETEFIQPLGVRLEGGDTLAVWWQPGETAYTWEISNQGDTHYVA